MLIMQLLKVVIVLFFQDLLKIFTFHFTSRIWTIRLQVVTQNKTTKTTTKGWLFAKATVKYILTTSIPSSTVYRLDKYDDLSASAPMFRTYNQATLLAQVMEQVDTIIIQCPHLNSTFEFTPKDHFILFNYILYATLFFTIVTWVNQTLSISCQRISGVEGLKVKFLIWIENNQSVHWATVAQTPRLVVCNVALLPCISVCDYNEWFTHRNKL